MLQKRLDRSWKLTIKNFLGHNLQSKRKENIEKPTGFSIRQWIIKSRSIYHRKKKGRERYTIKKTWPVILAFASACVMNNNWMSDSFQMWLSSFVSFNFCIEFVVFPFFLYRFCICSVIFYSFILFPLGSRLEAEIFVLLLLLLNKVFFIESIIHCLNEK